MKISVYNQKGESVKEIDLPKGIFDVEVNSDLLHQVVTCQRSNRRQNSAQTKDRSEVSGGGKKPWRQKGTGRARHGSNRSPIWIGGGVTFGPSNERNYKKKINKKEKRSALLMSLSSKASENLVVLTENIELKEPKTKELSFLKNLPCKDGTTLLVTDKNNQEIFLSARNIPNLKVVEARNLTALDVLSVKHLLLFENSLESVKDTFL